MKGASCALRRRRMAGGGRHDKGWDRSAARSGEKRRMTRRLAGRRSGRSSRPGRGLAGFGHPAFSRSASGARSRVARPTPRGRRGASDEPARTAGRRTPGHVKEWKAPCPLRRPRSMPSAPARILPSVRMFSRRQKRPRAVEPLRPRPARPGAGARTLACTHPAHATHARAASLHPVHLPLRVPREQSPISRRCPNSTCPVQHGTHSFQLHDPPDRSPCLKPVSVCMRDTDRPYLILDTDPELRPPSSSSTPPDVVAGPRAGSIDCEGPAGSCVGTPSRTKCASQSPTAQSPEIALLRSATGRPGSRF